MSVRTGDDTAEGPSATADEPRYAGIDLADGGVIVYDRERENAWIQAEAAVDLDAVA